MFCQIKNLSSCRDVEKIKKYLFSSDNYDENWLTECHVCFSTCNSLLVYAKQQKICILNTQWDNAANSNTFVESWSGSLHAEITSLLILNISAGESKETINDWLCVVVGFGTGEVGFYSDQGQLLILEKLDDDPVLRIKCHTGQHTNETDEVYIIFSNSICCLAASSLLQTLRYARVQLAKTHAGSKDLRVEGQNLTVRKLGFVDQDVICDASVIGLELSNTFDHLLAASTHGGFFVGYRSFAPHNTVVVGVGARPYIGFHQALEGGSVQPLINDVARAVASKIKSALPGWLGGGKAQSQNVVPQPPPTSDKMHCRFSLCDLRRRGLFSVLSPDRRLLAVVDSLGRVILIDVRRGVAIRMFKGYRNGQCGFLQVNEESSKRKSIGRKVLFLILYIAKRGILEIWPLRGPRIVAFSTVQNARLLYYTHSILVQGSRRSTNINMPSVTLLSPDGQMKYFTVPFHFALNSESSNRARDVHIIKKLRQIIKEMDSVTPQLKTEIINILKELQTTEIKIHCIEMMVACKNIVPDILFICIAILCTSQNAEEPVNQEISKLNIICKNLFTLLLFYTSTNSIEVSFDDSIYNKSEFFAIENINDVSNDASNEETENNSNDNIETPFISESELFNLQHLLNLAIATETKRSHQTKVTFKDEKKTACSEFLLSFDLKSASDMIVMKETVSNESSLSVSQQIFDPYILNDLDWIDVKLKYINAKTISPLELRKLLLMYWMNLPLREITHQRMEKFGKIMYTICERVGFENVYTGYNETSSWWQSVRDYLIDSNCPFRSMVSAQLCRAVACKLEKQVENKQNELDDLWENVSKDNAQWGLLIGKLDDIAMLSILLSEKPEICDGLPNLPIELPEINLKFVYTKGKGSISELTAMWLCIAGIDPAKIIDNQINNENAENVDKKTSNFLKIPFKCEKKDVNMSIIEKLTLLRHQFPLSLNGNNLVTNMCWEYSLFWSKNIEDLKYLDAALTCIECIDNKALRCGISTIIWTTHLVPVFESACKLIGKVGKLPREKLSRQNVGLSDVQLLKFLEFVTKFLDLLLCSSLSAKENEDTIIRFEDIWEGNSLALIELAVANSNINIDILQIHYQLSAALYYQCFLGSNFWKHTSQLFDIESQRCMFGPLIKCPDNEFHHQSMDSRVMLQRTNFISRLVQKSVEFSKNRDEWIEHLQDLAKMWRVNDDHVRCEHVVHLYAQGLDTEAEEALLSVTNIKPLIDILVPMVGRRVKHFIDGKDNWQDIISALPTQATNYLRALEDVPNESVTVESLDATQRLLEIIISHIEKKTDKNLYKIALMLLDSCNILHDNC